MIALKRAKTLCVRFQLVGWAREISVIVVVPLFLFIDPNPNTFIITDAKCENLTWREVEALCLASCRLARIRNDFADVTSGLTKAIALATRTNNLRLLIKLKIQAALNELLMNNEAKAVSHLVESIQLANEGAYTRPFLNEQKSIVGLLEPTLMYMEQQQEKRHRHHREGHRKEEETREKP